MERVDVRELAATCSVCVISSSVRAMRRRQELSRVSIGVSLERPRHRVLIHPQLGVLERISFVVIEGTAEMNVGYH